MSNWIKEFVSHSQAGQDVFAAWCCMSPGSTSSISFLDVGANHPVEKSNSYGLEQSGWVGVCVERDDHCAKLFAATRPTTRFVHGDALTVNWTEALKGMPPNIAYLSLDLDECTLPCLSRLPFDIFEFQCATIEHDSYRFGPGPRDVMRGIMDTLGYDLLCADVRCDGLAFEDWYVLPKSVNYDEIEKLRCRGLPYQDILGRL